jgi:hypothetical protein
VANGCDWEPVDRFQSLADYEKFLSWINDQVSDGHAAAVPVEPTKAWGNAWDEHWYRCVSDRQVWRLVGPDPPFRGVFKRLEDTQPASDKTSS